jgi:two-component system sensor histidine kinase FlrB
VFALLPAGLLVLDGADRVVEANPAARELLGFDAHGCTWAQALHTAGVTDPAGRSEIVLGNGVRVSVASRSLEREPGRIVLLQDISETRRLQAELEHARRLAAMGEMVAGVAHQIRTPLATALLQVSRIEGGGDAAVAALDQLRRLERLVHDMLVFARRGELGFAPQALDGLLAELADRFRDAYAERGGRISVSIRDAALTIPANREALLSALSNLARNALHAVDDAPELHVRAARSGGSVRIDLVDQGPGIPDEQRARVFEPFYTTRASGTGLGLAVAAEVAERHGGSLELLPAARAHGAHFRMTLPLEDPVALLPGAGGRSPRTPQSSQEPSPDGEKETQP